MRLALSAALVPFVALGLTGCGDDDGGKKGSDPSSSSSSVEQGQDYEDTPLDQIGADVEEAMKALETVHLAGNIVDDDGQTILMDVTVSTAGDCEGSLTIKGTGAMDIIAVDGVSYFKADDDFWRSQGGAQADAIKAVIGDKWATDSTDPEGFAKLCDLDELLSDLDSDDITSDGAKVTGTQTIDGKETVTVSFTSEDGNPGVAYVASDEPHYFVRFDVRNEGAMVLSRFDEPLDIAKPDASEIVDLSKLG